MITDYLLTFSDNQSVSSTALSTDIIDLGPLSYGNTERDIALPISASVDLANNASQQYEIALTRAQTKFLEEQSEPVQRESELTMARF